MLHPFKKKIISLEIFIPLSHPTKHFTFKSGQEINFARVIAMSFMCYKFFLCLSGLTGGQNSLDLPWIRHLYTALTAASIKIGIDEQNFPCLISHFGPVPSHFNFSADGH